MSCEQIKGTKTTNNLSAVSSGYTSSTASSQIESYDAIVEPQKDATSESPKSVIENAETHSSHDISSKSSSTTKNQFVQSTVSQAPTQASTSVTVNSGKIVYASPKEIQPPQEADFGEYYDYALDLYNQFKSGNLEAGKKYEFPHLNQPQWDAKVIAFIDAFRTTCLKDVDSLIPRSTSLRSIYHQTLDNSSGETKIMMYLDENYFKEYQKIMWVQNTIQSIVGNGVTEKTVVDQIANWCIGNCSYNYDYQYTGVYRGEYTIAYDLLQSKKGICNDFAKLVSFTCDLYGIQNEFIATPEGREKRHAWNRICIGGTWYYIDVTWSVCAGYNKYPLTETLWENHNKYL